MRRPETLPGCEDGGTGLGFLRHAGGTQWEAGTPLYRRPAAAHADHLRLGLVRLPIAEVVWTLPAPVGAFLCSGGDLRAIALQLFNLALAVAIWWPFVRRYDRALAAAEVESIRAGD